MPKPDPGPDDMTGAQVRMARAFLRWSAAELAAKAGVGNSTIQRIEAEDGPPAIEGGLGPTLDYRTSARRESVTAVYDALVKAGVAFLPDTGEGIGIRGRARLSGASSLLKNREVACSFSFSVRRPGVGW